MGRAEANSQRVHLNGIFQANLSKLKRLPVLVFHRVVEEIPDGPLYDIHFTRENLDRLMRSIRKMGYETIHFEDLSARPIPRKPIILTFDDGYEDNYLHLLPLLQKHGMKAVIYLLGDRTIPHNIWDIPKGAPKVQLMTNDQILEMAKSGWVEFGSHSMTHVDLTQLPPDEMEREIRDCKSSLEGLLGKPVISFAYPFGRFNESVKRGVSEAGYLFGIAVEWSPDDFSDDLMEIRRICLSPDAGGVEFFWKTSILFPAFRRWQRRLFRRHLRLGGWRFGSRHRPPKHMEKVNGPKEDR